MDIKIFYSKTGFVQSDVFALVRNKRIFMRRKQVISFARGNIQSFICQHTQYRQLI